MNSKEFVHWMRGFVTACPKFHPTPEQWDLLVETLHKVKLEEPSIIGGNTTATVRGPLKGTIGTPWDNSKPQIWYGAPPENLAVQSSGTPPDYMMGYTSAVDREVDKILKG